MASGLAIILSSALVGVQAEMGDDATAGPIVNSLNIVFLAVFSADVLLRILTAGTAAWKDSWIVFDVVVAVAVSLLAACSSPLTDVPRPSQSMVPDILDSVVDTSSHLTVAASLARQLRVLRVFRSLRMVRALTYSFFCGTDVGGGRCRS